MAPHSSTLAWKIPGTEEPGGLQSTGSLRVGLGWATSLSLFAFMHWRRQWQPTPVFLAGESRGRGSLVGCRLWGHTESDTTEVTWQRQHQPYHLVSCLYSRQRELFIKYWFYPKVPCPGLNTYRLRKGLRSRTWECLDLHFPLTASLCPGMSVVLIETEGSPGVLPLEVAWALPSGGSGPALQSASPISLPSPWVWEWTMGSIVPGRVKKDSVTWERVLLSEMTFCFSWMSRPFPSPKLCVPWNVFDWFLYIRNCWILSWYTKLTVLLVTCKTHSF